LQAGLVQKLLTIILSTPYHFIRHYLLTLLHLLLTLVWSPILILQGLLRLGRILASFLRIFGLRPSLLDFYQIMNILDRIDPQIELRIQSLLVCVDLRLQTLNFRDREGLLGVGRILPLEVPQLHQTSLVNAFE
jgi:hypothetical protein